MTMKTFAKRYITLITTCAMCLFPLASIAQKIQVLNDTIDIGRTGYQVPVTATFELLNSSSKHLTIKEVKTDCGCTRIGYPRKSIGPGEPFTITLTYDARMLGHFQKQAAVVFHGSKIHQTLVMKGVVLRDWVDYTKVYPCRFGQLLTDADNIEFDDVNKGDRPQVTIRVFNNGGATMKPNLQHLPRYLTAEVRPQKLEGGQAGTILLTLNSDLLPDFGLTQDRVFMAQQLGETVGHDTEMPVSVVLLPKTSQTSSTSDSQAPCLSLSADSLELGLVDGKMHKKGTITVSNTGNSVLDISRLQLFTAGMGVTLGKRQLKPKETVKMKITIDREMVMAAKSRPRVLMITNDPKHSKVVIKINVK